MVSITNVEISNFRNIKSASFDLSNNLSNRCAVEGQNALGKTNVLEAICFALTNYLLDGSSDLKSIKPKDDMSAKVSVKLTFSNEKTFEKVYFENWVKTRGTEEVKLSGHTTEYYVNGAKVSSVASAQKQLMEDILEINYSPKTSKIDVLQMQVNPLWLFKYIDWSLLRKYIIELVGDVSNEEVIDKLFNDYEFLLVTDVKNDLVKNSYKTDVVLNLYKSVMNSAKQQANVYEHSIAEDKKIVDVNENEYQQALINRDAIINEKQSLINSKNTMVNPLVAQYEKEIELLKEQYNVLKEKELEEYSKNSAALNGLIQDSREKSIIASETYDNAIADVRKIADKIREEENIKNRLNEDISSLERRMQELRNNYDNVYNKTFDDMLVLPEALTCPHCGGVVNESYINAVKEDYENRKDRFEKSISNELQSIQEEAFRTKSLIESKKFELETIALNINDLVEEHKSLSDFANRCNENKVKSLAALNSLQSQLKNFQESVDSLYIKSQIDALNSKLNYERNRVVTNPDIDLKISQLDNQLNENEKIIDKRKFYQQIQEKIGVTKVKLSIEQRKINEYESRTMIVEEFIKTKLSMLDANIAAVFDDVEFILVSSNIKDGSWNQECYPLIVGTKTPFEHGSRSEQYVTAIKIVEKIKKLVGLSDIPYLIDEAGTFDSNTIVNKLITNSQIIASRMNDNYKVITVNEL